MDNKVYKADLVLDLRAKGYTEAEAEKAVRDVFTVLDERLTQGKEVVVTGHGTYKPKYNQPRQVPKKPKGTMSPATYTIAFSASVPLRQKLRQTMPAE